MSSDVSDRAVGLPGGAAVRPRARGVKRAVLIGAGLVLLAGAARYGDQWWRVGRFVMTTDDAYVGGNVTPLAAHVSGFVAAIPVGDNDYVRRGQVVLRLDANDLTAAVTRAEALVSQRRAAVAALQARYVAQHAVIAEAAAELAAKRAGAQFAVSTARAIVTSGAAMRLRPRMSSARPPPRRWPGQRSARRRRDWWRRVRRLRCSPPRSPRPRRL